MFGPRSVRDHACYMQQLRMVYNYIFVLFETNHNTQLSDEWVDLDLYLFKGGLDNFRLQYCNAPVTVIQHTGIFDI